MDQGKYDLIKPEWLIACYESETLLPREPKYGLALQCLVALCRVFMHSSRARLPWGRFRGLAGVPYVRQLGLWRCVWRGAMCPSRYLTFMCDATREENKLIVDRFGDHYTRPIEDVSELRDVFKRVRGNARWARATRGCCMGKCRGLLWMGDWTTRCSCGSCAHCMPPKSPAHQPPLSREVSGNAVHFPRLALLLFRCCWSSPLSCASDAARGP